MVIDTISWNEATLLVGAVVALLANVWLFVAARRSLARVLEARRNGVRLLVAHANLSREGARVLIQALFLVRALWAAATPEQVYAPAIRDAAEAYKAASVAILLIIQGLLVIASLMDLTHRRALVAEVNKLDAYEEAHLVRHTANTANTANTAHSHSRKGDKQDA